jgi:hypothetical protein
MKIHKIVLKYYYGIVCGQFNNQFIIRLKISIIDIKNVKYINLDDGSGKFRRWY